MYAKVFSQIFDSSIADDYRLRHFFMDMLVLADSNGVVDMTHSAIAARTRMPLDEVRELIGKLEQPDPQSRTAEADGRRIALLDEHRSWGWHIVNYQKFRQTATEEQRRENTRARVARFKAKRQQIEAGNAEVTQANASNAMQKEKHMQKQKQNKGKDFPPIPEALNCESFLLAWQSWNTHRHETKKKLSPLAAELQLRKLESMGAERAVAAINHSIMNSYQGIYEPKPDFAAPRPPSRPVRGPAAAPQATAPAVAGGPVTEDEWKAHYLAAMEKGYVEMPESQVGPAAGGYWAAVHEREDRKKALAVAGGVK